MSERQEVLPLFPAMENDHGARIAHYALKEDITRAFITGDKIAALCGKVWVPARDPNLFPICNKCEQILHLSTELRPYYGKAGSDHD